MNAPHAITVAAIVESLALADGEKYAGIVFGKDGAPDHHLVMLAGDVEKKWKDAKDWADQLGGALPTRREQALLYANLPEEFQDDWYWSGEQHASDSSFAWMQDFSSGYQGCYRTSYEYRARAVRRVPIQ